MLLAGVVFTLSGDALLSWSLGRVNVTGVGGMGKFNGQVAFCSFGGLGLYLSRASLLELGLGHSTGGGRWGRVGRDGGRLGMLGWNQVNEIGLRVGTLPVLLTQPLIEFLKALLHS